MKVVMIRKFFFEGKVPLKISLGSRVHIINSFRFLQCSLEKLPKTFNLPVKKGMFPHDLTLLRIKIMSVLSLLLIFLEQNL